MRQEHDEQEIRIYINQLKKALKYLPLGSRAYYYVSGELVRAGAELKTLGTPTRQSQGNGGTRSPYRSER